LAWILSLISNELLEQVLENKWVSVHRCIVNGALASKVALQLVGPKTTFSDWLEQQLSQVEQAVLSSQMHDRTSKSVLPVDVDVHWVKFWRCLLQQSDHSDDIHFCHFRFLCIFVLLLLVTVDRG
jgi:hypothetical protein